MKKKITKTDRKTTAINFLLDKNVGYVVSIIRLLVEYYLNQPATQKKVYQNFKSLDMGKVFAHSVMKLLCACILYDDWNVFINIEVKELQSSQKPTIE